MQRNIIKLEIDQQNNYNTYEDLDLNEKFSKEYKNTKLYFIFDVKYDSRYKARLIADEHLTGISLSSIYSSIVFLKGIWLVLFLAKPNKLDSQSTDICNAYLQAMRKENLYIIIGREFGNLKRYTLTLRRNFMALRVLVLDSMKGQLIALETLKFSLAKIEPDFWIKDCDYYNYIVVYINDLLLASKDPDSIVKIL